MGKKRLLILACLVLLLAGAFSLNRNTFSKAVPQNLPSPAHPSTDNPAVPDYVVYNFLFRKVVRLREKTRALQAQGRIGQKPYFPLQREAGLSEGQANALEAIAFACWQQVTRQNEKAQAIINAFQSRFPEGRIPQGGAPPPPPELKALWEERNAMILRARDQLRVAFGEEAFGRFDNYAKFHHGTNTSPVTINPVNPKAKQR